MSAQEYLVKRFGYTASAAFAPANTAASQILATRKLLIVIGSGWVCEATEPSECQAGQA